MNLIIGIQNLAVSFWDYVNCLFAIIPKLLYLLASFFFTIVDVFQLFFRKLAGLDVYYVDGESQSGDIVYHFLNGIVSNDGFPLLTTVFWGLIILGVILLILSTIIAIIRNEYAGEGDKYTTPAKIVGKSFRSLFFFAIVPIVCLFGVYLGNVILVAVDKATSAATSDSINLKTSYLDRYKIDEKLAGTTTTDDHDHVYGASYIAYSIFGVEVGCTTTTFSGALFKASAYTSNRIRTTENSLIDYEGTQVNGFLSLINQDYASSFGGLFNSDDPDIAAMYVDEAFANNVLLKKDYQQALKYPEGYIRANNVESVDPFAYQQKEIVTNFDRYNVSLVWYYYNLWEFNFLVAYASVIILLTIFVNIILGLMKRIIELVALFLISAPLIAIMPLDGGNAYGSWRKKFIGKTLMTYGAVAGMNILFLVLPYLNEITFFNIDPVDYLIQSIFLIVGIMLVKDFITMMGEFIGGENAESAGGAIASDIGKNIGKAGALIAAPLAAGGAVAGAAAKIGLKAAKGAGKAATAKKRFNKATTERNDKISTAKSAVDARAKMKPQERRDEIDKEIGSDPEKKAKLEKEAEDLYAREHGYTGADDETYQVSSIKNDFDINATNAATGESYLTTAKDIRAVRKDKEVKKQYEDAYNSKAPDKADYYPHPVANVKNSIGGAKNKIVGSIKSIPKAIDDAKIVAPVAKSIKKASDANAKVLTDNSFIGGIKGGLNEMAAYFKSDDKK